MNEEKEPKDPKDCIHEFVSVEFIGQTYGTCLDCGATVFKRNGKWGTM